MRSHHYGLHVPARPIAFEWTPEHVRSIDPRPIAGTRADVVDEVDQCGKTNDHAEARRLDSAPLGAARRPFGRPCPSRIFGSVVSQLYTLIVS